MLILDCIKHYLLGTSDSSDSARPCQLEILNNPCLEHFLTPTTCFIYSLSLLVESSLLSQGMAELTLQVKASSTTTYTIKVPATATVLSAKEAIEEQSKIPVANQRLIYSGQVLANEKTLESYGPCFLQLALASPFPSTFPCFPIT